jgi:hypothetical protein
VDVFDLLLLVLDPLLHLFCAELDRV